ncbi:hypothetical protein [Embleya sp. NPDC005575]|uniref:hypothetical protein n=1 Tax=Embleya sp. NPDC005575 TaxID=3156892 RepID=UPI00339EA3F4
MSGEASSKSGDHPSKSGDHPWRNFVAAFVSLYVLIGIVMTATGATTLSAWTAPLILVVPALGVALVRYRKTRI